MGAPEIGEKETVLDRYRALFQSPEAVRILERRRRANPLPTPTERKVMISGAKLSCTLTPIPTLNMRVSPNPVSGPLDQLMHTVEYPGKKPESALVRSEYYPSSAPELPQMMRHLYEKYGERFQVVVIDLENEDDVTVLKLFRRRDWDPVQLPQSLDDAKRPLPGEEILDLRRYSVLRGRGVWP